ncbi:MAG: cyclodeaminase/cyclohydrolase family protein [Vicinamibacteria bacterium]|nr:cyclodeaminase/cyclohydrolase family protein [Vicinamibacteria bacterium]
MSLLSLTSQALLDRFASQDPTPGGGSAAALAGALAGALVEMVAGLPKSRTGVPEEREKLDAAKASAEKAGARLRQLVDLDTDAYNAVTAAYRLPKATDEEKAVRKQAIAAAMRQATEVPLETCERTSEVLRAAAQALAHGNPNAASDARTAMALCRAALDAGAENVRANVGSPSLAAEAPLFLARLETIRAPLESMLANPSRK